MADDPFVTSSATQQPHIYRPIPRRNFSANTDSTDSPSDPFAPSTPPLHDSNNRSSDFLTQLNARLLRTYNARNGSIQESSSVEGGQPPPRNKSFLDMTRSTLFGIYDEESGTTGDRSVAETPWGTGAETPGRSSCDAGMWGNGMGSPDAGLAMKSRSRQPTMNGRGPRSSTAMQSPKPARQGAWKYTVMMGKLAALFLFGVIYGVIVSHLHDTRELAAVRVGGVDRESWIYLASWGLAGVMLGSLLPYVDLVWDGHRSDSQRKQAQTEKENPPSLSEHWNDVVRSVGAFVGIAFAIRRLPWQSTLQLTVTLALVNPALWYILDRSKPGLSFSLIVTSILTSFIFLSNPDVLPSPSLPATTNATHSPSPNTQTPVDAELFAGMVSYETLAIVTWVGSVLFCSCVCFGSIGRRLAVWER
ncbi:hypothetical protein BU26DRAFT_515110 [Trematosphaeria pertusa]|uniref:INSIG domain-containing protein n=1 Tax=Trematosphaeria pertusa TaxID=390896 RepID=A0A6A6J0L8_9PLEO|nr:uncharacterized protein BU26DRAFT_515110 [Trematosphaeria pertusa]KAF2255400.1 hypothetical protein BU26DRAFT_515110 [Trematosphaeria pertusa]